MQLAASSASCSSAASAESTADSTDSGELSGKENHLATHLSSTLALSMKPPLGLEEERDVRLGGDGDSLEHPSPFEPIRSSTLALGNENHLSSTLALSMKPPLGLAGGDGDSLEDDSDKEEGQKEDGEEQAAATLGLTIHGAERGLQITFGNSLSSSGAGTLALTLGNTREPGTNLPLALTVSEDASSTSKAKANRKQADSCYQISIKAPTRGEEAAKTPSSTDRLACSNGRNGRNGRRLSTTSGGGRRHSLTITLGRPSGGAATEETRIETVANGYRAVNADYSKHTHGDATEETRIEERVVRRVKPSN